jgi:plastocyanin
MHFRSLLKLSKTSMVPAAAAFALASMLPVSQASAAAATGTIKGHVHLLGKLPGNPVIRMGMDPKCAEMNRGKMTVQETVVATIDGSLGNVFVAVQGNFPATPVPAQPVVLDQRGCVYRPRVIGMRAGQTLQVKNSDEVMHNVHASSGRGNSFNVSEPKAGMVQTFTLKADEQMVHISCDIHRWMNAYVGVVSHPYFAVTDTAGNFTIANVPAGTYPVRAWQEHYGFVSKTITIKPGATTTVDFTYGK